MYNKQTDGPLCKHSMNQNESKWIKMDQNGSKWIKMDQNGSKWIKMDQNGSELQQVMAS
jgi:hypothetical protein